MAEVLIENFYAKKVRVRMDICIYVHIEKGLGIKEEWPEFMKCGIGV